MIAKAALYAGILSQLGHPVLGALHEQLVEVPAGWTAVGTPDDSATLSLQIGLALQNLDQLEPKLLAVSTPGNEEYGQHLDIDDVNALFAPTAEANTAVLAWLQSAGISNVASDGQWVNFAAPVGTINDLLNTTFLIYENIGGQKIRTTEYSIPDSLSGYIDLISPTTYFGKTTAFIPTVVPTPVEKRQDDYDSTEVQLAASCYTGITPACLKQLYSVGDYTPEVSSGSRIAFGSFLNESAIELDLVAFEQSFNISSQNFSVQLINGGVNDQNESTALFGEANLDSQTIVGLSHPLPVTEFITGGSPPFIPNLDEPLAVNNSNEPYLPYYTYLLSKPNSELPQVISNSYGDDEQTVPEYYAKRVCNMIGMLGLRGISVMESSGDTGVGAPCQSNNGLKTPQFTPQFPGTCPYITGVGGTQNLTPEVAWTGGSGGFSNYFSRPAYQDAAVETYLTKYISPAVKDYYEPYTNFSNRGFPDVSSHSLSPGYVIAFDGELYDGIGGTSAAAPAFSSIIALLNDARLRAGKPVLGFLNPFLYSTGYTALTDITAGGSVGCNGVDSQYGEVIPGASIIPWASWNATVGWDPVTGLGTPNFAKLKDLVLSF